MSEISEAWMRDLIEMWIALAAEAGPNLAEGHTIISTEYEIGGIDLVIETSSGAIRRFSVTASEVFP